MCLLGSSEDGVNRPAFVLYITFPGDDSFLQCEVRLQVLNVMCDVNTSEAIRRHTCTTSCQSSVHKRVVKYQ